jgi:CheY-like chemotaxis protein
MSLTLREDQQHTLSQQVNGSRRWLTSSLILTGNVCIGHQVASLLHNVGWQTQVIHDDRQAYDLLYRENVDSVVVDIDTPGLHGLSCLCWCKFRRPSIAVYAICSGGNTLSMQAARNLGCRGYFYLRQHKILVDTRCGMARGLTSSQ